MSNQNNLYPQISNEPFLGKQAPPPPVKVNQPQGYPYVQPYNNQGYPASNQTFPNNNQGYQPNNQGFQPNNQGYQPGNQGFQPNNQGYQPPNDQGFSPSPSGLHCPFCSRQTESFPKKAAGGVTYIWCFALFLLTGIFCCVPFCVDGCKDTLMVCVICQGVKAKIAANCC